MTPDEAIEQARWYEREDIATTLRESANVLADECERLRGENERRREELRLAQCPNPRDPEHGGHCETCSGLSVARTRRLHELEAECERLRERVRVLEEALEELAGYDLSPNRDAVAHEMRDEARAALAKGGE